MRGVVDANVVGGINGYAAAARVMLAQPRHPSGAGGRIFFVDGRGGEGGPTPDGAAYGCTKAANRQLWATLVEESKGTGGRLGVHLIQPGMMVTPLLLDKGRPLSALHIKVRR